jgi:outer membrane protein assembly factor BamB
LQGRLSIALVAWVAMQSPATAADPGPADLWAAAKRGDAAAVESLLCDGVDINARTEYGVTALHFAAGKGHLEVVRTLLKFQIDVNAKDRFYQITALDSASDKPEIVAALLEAGAEGADGVLMQAVVQGQLALVEIVLAKAKVKQETLDRALKAAAKSKPEIAQALEKAGAVRAAVAQSDVPLEKLQPLVGAFRNDEGIEVAVAVTDGSLALVPEGVPPILLTWSAEDTFQFGESAPATVKFRRDGERVVGFTITRPTSSAVYSRFDPLAAATKVTPIIDDQPGVITPQNWPTFRGPGAAGVADGQWPPMTWDLEKQLNIRWKTPIPGLGHSCPIVWGERVYLTTAVRADGKSDLKIGLYGDVDSVEDKSEHSWRVYCIDKESGRVVWEQIAHQGVPKVQRHTKATHANCTPVTNGSHVVASFGSEGLFCYDTGGKLLWKRDLGRLDSGWFFNADYQWGFGSSPVIYRDLVIVQCDVGPGSSIAAFRLEDGAEVWRTPREEIPSWGTPTIVEGPGRVELVTSATKFARGYDPLTGVELWRLGPHSEITVPTPFYAGNLIFLSSGYRPIQPIYALRPGATGDISLPSGETSSEFIAWSTQKGGPYMPTPIAYGGQLYVCSNMGILTCHELETGKQVYKQRLPGKGAYTASPVAGDGKIFFTSEEGAVHVVKAGSEFTVLASNQLGAPCLATPAISDGMIFFRTETFLLAVGRR